MANIAISELDTETTSLGDNDLLLVSKDNGSSYTSAKMKGSVLKSGVGDIASINEKLDSIAAKLDDLSVSQKSNFDLLIEMNTKIGNKVFGQEGGEISPDEKYTLTLNKAGVDNTIVDLIDDPVGGGIYNKGTRVVITADMKPFCVFSGWYRDNELITTNITYSIEVDTDITLTAKYNRSYYWFQCYLNCLNYSDFDVLPVANYDLYSNGYCSKISKQTYSTPIKVVLPFIKDSGDGFCTVDFTTQNVNDIDKIKLSLNSEHSGSEKWSSFKKLVNGDLAWWYSRAQDDKYYPNNGDTLPGLFVIENA